MVITLLVVMAGAPPAYRFSAHLALWMLAVPLGLLLLASFALCPTVESH
jgi:hypothetical protein